MQFGQDLLDWPQLRVPGRLAVGEFGGVCGAKVGPVTAEDCRPLLASIPDTVRNKVRDVVLAAAGHPDVGRRRGGVLAYRHVGAGCGFTLHSVHGAGVGQLDMFAHVAGGQHALAVLPRDVDVTV